MSAWDWIVAASAVVSVAGVLVWIFASWSGTWGSREPERTARMPGDAYLEDLAAPRIAMTRAISLEAPPAVVWPWLAQLGRGAGWYSVDRLDNGGIESARHLVSWIPPPALGDATAIGYLRHLEEGRALTWWVPRITFFGAAARLVVDMRLREEEAGSRLVTRMSADATGVTARAALFIFRGIDGIMAVRQLRGVKARVERYGARTADPGRPETGARDLFQRYEVIYASGERAGVPGVELAKRWRQAAIADGVLTPHDPI